MDRSNHTLPCLFAQLGLKNNELDINNFISKHKGIPSEIILSNAEFWSSSQASFLSQAIVDDSDWSEVVDSLDNLLRSIAD